MVNPKLGITSKFPLHIDIESTNACNLKCTMCMRNFMTEKIGFIEMDTYKKIFESGIPYAIKLSWRGEPLLHSRITDMVQYAKGVGVFEVLLNTNGLLLTEEIATALAKAGLDWLIISVDGATPATYNRIRQGGDFETLFHNIAVADYIYEEHNYKTKIRIQICKQPLNEDEIDLWKDTFKWYADSLRVGKLHDPQGKFGYKIKQPYSCPQPWRRITVSWNGDIHPCPSDYQGRWTLSNIHSTSIYDAWHSITMDCMRRYLIVEGRQGHPACENCTSYC